MHIFNPNSSTFVPNIANLCVKMLRKLGKVCTFLAKDLHMWKKSINFAPRFAMTKLSVNINKVATLRNARGGNVPDVLQFALDCEAFGECF